jgi:ankyrin repeat protein
MKKKTVICMVLVAVMVLALCLGIFLCNGFLQNRILFEAIEANDYENARTAIKCGAFLEMPRHLVAVPEIVMTNPTPLIAACDEGNQDIVALLLDHGADINKRDNCTGQTPLLAALHGSKQNRFSLAFYLIENGADIHIQQRTNSALQETLFVSENDSEQTVSEGYLLFQYLLAHNVDKTIPLQWENTLTYAAHYRNYNAVRYLLENGYFTVDELDPRGNTALIVAAQYNQIEIAQLLLDRGASRSIADDSGKTAYDYAVEKGYEEIAQLLRPEQ